MIPYPRNRLFTVLRAVKRNDPVEMERTILRAFRHGYMYGVPVRAAPNTAASKARMTNMRRCTMEAKD